VTKTGTVSLHGNTYEVDAALIGRRVELVFDPFDLTDISVRYAGRDLGTAIPRIIGRHVHPAAKPTEQPPAPVTGIDYLALVRARHTTTLASARVDYAALATPPDGVLPGQTDLLHLLEQVEQVEQVHDTDDTDDPDDPDVPDRDLQELS